MKKILFFSSAIVFCSTTLIAQTDTNKTTKNSYTAEAIRSSTGVDIVTKGKISSGSGKVIKYDTYFDTVLYNDVLNKTSQNGATILSQHISTADNKSINLARPLDKYIEQVKKQTDIAREQAKKEELASKKQTIPRYFVGGYCVAMQKTELIKSSGFSSFDCVLDFGESGYRKAEVFTAIYPDYKREIAIGIPIYATFRNGNKADFNGVILNSKKTSLNIANEVETFKIRQYITKYGLAISDVAYQYSTAYLNQLHLSQVQQQIDYIPTETSNGGTVTTPVQTTNVTPPDASEYLTLAGISLLDRLFAIGSENIMEDTTPLFTISKGQRVYIEGVVSFDKASTVKKFGKLSEDIKQEAIKNNSNYINQFQEYKKQLDSKNVNHQLVIPTQTTIQAQ